MRIEPAMTSPVIPDLIRDPVHPYVRMRLRIEPAMTSLVIPDLIRDPVHQSVSMIITYCEHYNELMDSVL